jgi:hypothetical protein
MLDEAEADRLIARGIVELYVAAVGQEPLTPVDGTVAR